MKQISILGCGWLGFPLAESLLRKGFSVNGSTTSEKKISVLKNAKVNPFLISVSENEIDGNMDLFLQNSDVLIIDFPPKLRSENSENYVQKIKNVIPFIEKSSVHKVIFISSTSVFDDAFAIIEITEQTIANSNSESGKQILQAEILLKDNSNFKTTVLRFSGLFGEDRHPIHFLSGRKNLENPEAPINLIHQTDCIGIIESIIETETYNEIFNASFPFHPTRKDYYTQKAIDLNLELPEFNSGQKSIGKIIDSSKIEKVLNYKFRIQP